MVAGETKVKKGKYYGVGPRWTAKEDAVLREYWYTVSARTLLEHVNKVGGNGRNWRAVYRRATRLKLPKGIPQGFVSVHTLAREQSLDVKTLVRIVERARKAKVVKTGGMHAYRMKTVAPKKMKRFVDSYEALKALEWWWGRVETLRQAAERLQCNRHTLREVLKRAGIIKNSVMGQKLTLRKKAVTEAWKNYQKKKGSSSTKKKRRGTT